MAEKIKVLISEEEVDARIRELGEKISKEYEGKVEYSLCANLQRELQFRYLWTLCVLEAMATEQSPVVL